VLVPQLKAELSNIPGILQVLTNAEARPLGIPAEKDSDQAPHSLLMFAALLTCRIEVFGGLRPGDLASKFTGASLPLFTTFYYFLTIFYVVGDWKPLATAGMKCQGKLNVLTLIWA
jgi:hypothetical protein